MHKVKIALVEISRQLRWYIPGFSYEKKFRFYEVEKGKCYRSAQLTRRAWKYFLGKYKFHSVVVLVMEPESYELELARKYDLHILNLGMIDRPPTDIEADNFLTFVQNPKNQPVLIHCRWGRDRTGCFCFLYRVELMGWVVQRAWQEMKALGHKSFPWHSSLSYFKNWLEERYNTKLPD